MIYKIIAVYEDGSKIIRNRSDWKLRLGRWLKKKPCGSRPYLIQVFGTDFDEKDRREMVTDFRPTLHPVHGQMTVNGEHVISGEEWRKN